MFSLLTFFSQPAKAGGPTDSGEAVCCHKNESTSTNWTSSYVIPHRYKARWEWVKAAACKDSTFYDQKSGTTIATTRAVEDDQKKCFDDNAMVCCEIVPETALGKPFKPAAISWMPKNSCPKKVDAINCDYDKGQGICCAWKSGDGYQYAPVLREDCARGKGAMVQNERICPSEIPGYRNVSNTGTLDPRSGQPVRPPRIDH